MRHTLNSEQIRNALIPKRRLNKRRFLEAIYIIVATVYSVLVLGVLMAAGAGVR